MEKQYVNINGVPTKVLTWGKSLNNSGSGHLLQENLNHIICIPGNPGITDVYIEFLEQIYKNTNSIVWIVGHAGHEFIDLPNMPSPEENKNLYSLPGQVKHKISFIETYVPKNAKITLIGHSIGSHIILKLLKVPSIHSRVVRSYLLFPTIEYMAESINGLFLAKVLKYFLFPLILLAKIFNMFPLILQNLLLSFYFKISSIPHKYTDIIRDFLHPYPVRNCLSMALDEMLQVRERDNNSLKKNVDRIKLYYGATDGWTPFSYYVNIKKDIPTINAEVCDKGMAHAFVLRDSKSMADMIVDWIKMQ